MSTWENYRFVVPTLSGSRWSPWKNFQQHLRSSDLDWPRVGLYCPHEPLPYLVGSFTVSAAVRERLGRDHWTWRPEFITGDARLISLESASDPDSPVRASVELVGNRVRTQESEDRLLDDAAAAMERGDFATAEKLTQEHSANWENIRTTVTPQCLQCGTKVSKLRLEKVQDLLSRLWSLGMRELTLEQFDFARHEASGRNR